MGGLIWQGYDTLFGSAAQVVYPNSSAAYLAQKFPGIGKEFMPPLDEGAYLYMPVTMPTLPSGRCWISCSARTGP